MQGARRKLFFNYDEPYVPEEEEEEHEEEWSSLFSEEEEEEPEEAPISPTINKVHYLLRHKRNAFVDRQIGYMDKMMNIAQKSDDVHFSAMLQAKVQNMYREVEPLMQDDGTKPSFVKTYSFDTVRPFGAKEEQDVSITKRIKRRGQNPLEYDLKKIGKKASKLYRKRYGRRPARCVRYIHGKPVIVNRYSETEGRHIIDKVLDEYL